MSDLPFSQACENNKQPILDVLLRHLDDCRSVLEIGGGTGQHAVYFAQHFAKVLWQSTDVPGNVDALNLRIEQAQLENLPRAIALDVNQKPWPSVSGDALFTANSLHIMSADSVENFFTEVGDHCKRKLLVYGPFKYAGEFTTESNAHFDLWLKDRDPQSGVRDFEWVNRLAGAAGFELLEDNAMPANNQLLVWQAKE